MKKTVDSHQTLVRKTITVSEYQNLPNF